SRRPQDPVHRREPRELSDLGAEGLRDRPRPPRPPVSRRRNHGGLSRLSDEGRRRGRRLSPLPDPQLRQGTTHADQEARQRRPHHAEPRHAHRSGVAMGRLLTVCLVALAVFWVSPAPADDPEVPEKYLSVDEANALLEQKKPVTFIDVRPKEQFDDLHIRG